MNDSVLQNALRLSRAGKFAEAAQLYQDILRRDPKQFDALHALGILCYQSGRLDEADRLIGEAVRINPRAADALYNRGCLLLNMSRLDEAVDCFNRAIALKPDYVEALGNRANVFLRLGRPIESLADCDKIVALRPKLPQGWATRAGALLALKRPSDALASFDRALAIRQDYLPVWIDRASALLALQREDEAVASLDKALAIDPKNSEIVYRRADLLLWLKRHSEAARAYEHFLSLRPDHSEGWNRLGVCFIELKRQADALACFDKAVALDAKNVDAWNNRANVYFEMKRFLEAARDYRETLKLAPNLPFVEGFLIQSRLRVCDWRFLDEDRRKLTAALARGKSIIDPQGNLAISRSPEDQLQCARTFMAGEASVPQISGAGRHSQDRIRLAYLSADFRPHPVAFLIAGVFEHHDKTRFETIGVSFGPSGESQIRSRIAAAFDHFVDVRDRSDSEAAAMLKRLNVDIAVDLMAFTEGCRPGILARRPAPIQINFLGFPATMGAAHIDYIFADRFLIREDERGFYGEQVVYLPDTYQANDSKRSIADRVPARRDMGLPEAGVVFCCFNNNYKITPKIFDVWMRLLSKVDGSVLWLLEDNAPAAGNLRREAVTRGVAPERLVFASRAAPAEHLARQKLADLFIDTSPYCAHTTCSDALWVGLPVVTYYGPTFASRVASSLLNAIGLPELITHSLEEYEALAFRLARDKEALAAIKAKLAGNRDLYPLFDTALFTRNLESAYAAMMKRYFQGLPPQSFAVDRLP